MMNKLQKFVDVANNQTKLDMVAKGNTTKEAGIKAKAAKAQTKLTAMTSNATFMAACAAIEGKKTTAENGISSTNLKSAASMLKDAGAGAIGLSTILVVVVGMFAL